MISFPIIEAEFTQEFPKTYAICEAVQSGTSAWPLFADEGELLSHREFRWAKFYERQVKKLLTASQGVGDDSAALAVAKKIQKQFQARRAAHLPAVQELARFAAKLQASLVPAEGPFLVLDQNLFSFLRSEDRGICRLVCRFWTSQVPEALERIKHYFLGAHLNYELFSIAIEKQPRKEGLADAVEILYRAGLLTEENTGMLLATFSSFYDGMPDQKKSNLAYHKYEDMLLVLWQNDLLTEQRFRHLCSVEELVPLSSVAVLLGRANLLNEKRWQRVCKTISDATFSGATSCILRNSIVLLSEARLLSDETLDVITMRSDNSLTLLALCYLKEYGDLNLANFQRIAALEDPSVVTKEYPLIKRYRYGLRL